MYVINNTIITYDKIIKILKNEFKEDFPTNNFGYIAGQAVASAIFEIIQSKRLVPVYNDLDLFVPLTIDIQHKIKYYDNNNNGINSYEVLNMPKTERYQQLNSKILFKQKRLYNIVNSFRMNRLNKTIITVPNQITPQRTVNTKYEEKWDILKKNLNNFMFLLIDNFDINSVQCGIDLMTKELYISKNFIDFINTNQLRIINYELPHHAIVRYLTKKNELNCFGNNDYELGKVNSILYFMNENKSIFNVDFMGVGEQYLKKIKYINYNNFFNFEKKVRKHYSKKDIEYYNFGSLGTDDFTKNYKKDIYSDFFKSDDNKLNQSLKIPEIIDFETFSKKSIKNYYYDLNNLEKLESLGYLFNLKNLTEIPNQIFLNKIIKKIQEHPEELNFLKSKSLSVLDYKLVFDHLFKLEEEYKSIIYSFLKNNQNLLYSLLDNDLQYIFKEKLIKYINTENTPLKECEIESYKYNDIFSITELTNTIDLKMEGDTMGHCVGGYANQLSNGTTIILQMKPLNNDTEYRTTIQLNREQYNISKKEDSLIQNKQLTKKEIIEKNNLIIGIYGLYYKDKFQLGQIYKQYNIRPKNYVIKAFKDSLQNKEINITNNINNNNILF